MWHPTSPIGVNPVIKSCFICSVTTFPDVTTCLVFPFVQLKPEIWPIILFYLFLYIGVFLGKKYILNPLKAHRTRWSACSA